MVNVKNVKKSLKTTLDVLEQEILTFVDCIEDATNEQLKFLKELKDVKNYIKDLYKDCD